MAVRASLGAETAVHQALHAVAVAAAQPCLLVHVGSHFKIGLAVDDLAPLVAVVILARSPPEKVGADKVALVAAVACIRGRAGEGVDVGPVAVGAGTHMAVGAVLPEKVGVMAAERPVHEGLFGTAGGHGLGEDALIAVVAVGAFPCPVAHGGALPRFVAVGAAQTGVGAAEAYCRGVGHGRPAEAKAEQAQSAQGSDPARHSRVPSGK